MSDWISREVAIGALEDRRNKYLEDGPNWLQIQMDILTIRALPAVQTDLTDPVVVHANMLRGAIAKPTLDQIIHLYGVDALCRALVPVIVKEAAFAAPHVNETPKSEHDAANVLTPAKGDA